MHEGNRINARPDECDDEGCPHYGTPHGHVRVIPELRALMEAARRYGGGIFGLSHLIDAALAFRAKAPDPETKK